MKGYYPSDTFWVKGGGGGIGRKVESEIIYLFDGMFQNIAH